MRTSCAKKRPLTFEFFIPFSAIFSARLYSVFPGNEITGKCIENLKRKWTLSSTTTALKFGQYGDFGQCNTLLFINCSEFIFEENDLPSPGFLLTFDCSPKNRDKVFLLNYVEGQPRDLEAIIFPEIFLRCRQCFAIH